MKPEPRIAEYESAKTFYKGLHFESVKAIDTAAGIIEAIVAVFGNVDSSYERIVQGAFLDSLSEGLPKGVWMHDWEKPVAKTLEARELQPGDPLLPTSIKQNGGLYVKAQFNLDTQRGRESFSDISKGIIDEFSIGYRPLKWLMHLDDDGDVEVMDLLQIKLYEWSPVLAGCNPMTALLSAKSANVGLRLIDHSAAVLEAAKGFMERVNQLVELRRSDVNIKEGRTLNSNNVAMLTEHQSVLYQTAEQLKSQGDAIGELIASAVPNEPLVVVEDPPAKNLQLRIRAERERFGLMGITV